MDTREAVSKLIEYEICGTELCVEIVTRDADNCMVYKKQVPIQLVFGAYRGDGRARIIIEQSHIDEAEKLFD